MKPSTRRWALPAVAAIVILAAGAAVLVASSGDDEQAADVGRMPRAFDGGMTLGSGDTLDTDTAIDSRTGRIYVSWAAPSPGVKSKGDYAEPHDMWVARSDDRGKTFSEPVRANRVRGDVANVGFNGAPKLQVTESGDVLAVFGFKEPKPAPGFKDGMWRVRIARSTDGGKSFTRDRDIVARDEPHSDLYQAVAASGKQVYAAYLDYAEEKTALRFMVSEDGGKTFGESTLGDQRTCECCDNSVAADSRGRVFVAFRDQAQGGKETTVRDSAVIRSDDGGKSWSDPIDIGDDNWVFNGCPESGPEIVVDAKDRLHGIYHTGKEGRAGIYYARSLDRGRSFEKAVPVLTGEFYPPATLDLGVDGAGAAWLAWDDARTKDRKVWVGQVTADGRLLRSARPLASGETPSLAAHDDLVVLTWATKNGVRVTTAGRV